MSDNGEAVVKVEHLADVKATETRRPKVRMPSDSILYEKVVPILLALFGMAFVAVILGIIAGLATGVLTIR